MTRVAAPRKGQFVTYRSFGNGSQIRLLLVVSGFFFIILIFFITIAFSNHPSAAVEATRINQQRPDSPLDMMDVLVPVHEIEQGSPLEPGMFKILQRPRTLMPRGTIGRYEDVRGKYARSTILPLLPLQNEYVTSVAPSNPIATNIPRGFRAVTMKVDATTGIEGWARSGVIVDVAWVTKRLGETLSKIIVQNAKVLSAERTVDPDVKQFEPVPTTVTLLVMDRDANKISLASSSGILVLHMRGTADQGVTASGDDTLTMKQLLDTKVEGALMPNIQGRVKAAGPDGKVRTWELVDGKLVKQTDPAEDDARP